jgi:hypothetical protein
MTTPTFTPSDIVRFAAAKDAVNISTAFDQLVGQKIVDAIDARKQYVASTMFGQETEAEEASAEDQGSEEASDEVDNTVGSQEQSDQETEESNEDAEQHA